MRARIGLRTCGANIVRRHTRTSRGRFSGTVRSDDRGQDFGEAIEGGAASCCQAIDPAFDPLKPAIDVALQDAGRARDACIAANRYRPQRAIVGEAVGAAQSIPA
jgi:hypothetical protein